MITDKQVEAALIAFDPLFQGRIDDAHANMWRAKMRAALEAAEKAAWRPIEEWDGKRGFAIVADCFGSQPAEFDPDPTLEEFLSICDEGEDEDDFAQYLAEFPGEGWRTTTADEVEFLDPTHFRPLPKGPSDD